MAFRRDLSITTDILMKKYQSAILNTDLMIKQFGITSDISVDTIINVQKTVRGTPSFIDPNVSDIGYRLSDGVATNVNPRESDISYT